MFKFLYLFCYKYFIYLWKFAIFFKNDFLILFIHRLGEKKKKKNKTSILPEILWIHCDLCSPNLVGLNFNSFFIFQILSAEEGLISTNVPSKFAPKPKELKLNKEKGDCLFFAICFLEACASGSIIFHSNTAVKLGFRGFIILTYESFGFDLILRWRRSTRTWMMLEARPVILLSMILKTMGHQLLGRTISCISRQATLASSFVFT